MEYEKHPISPNTYVTPLASDREFHFVSAFDIYNPPNVPDGQDVLLAYYFQEVFFNGISVFKKEVFGAVYTAFGPNIYDQDLSGYKAILSSGIYRVNYEYGYAFKKESGGYDKQFPPLGKCYYTFRAVPNKLPLKPWTVTDVINRMIEIAEPIRKGEKPRYRMNGMRADGTIITEENKQEGEEVGQAAKFDTILCPQLAFTKNHLREILQEIGKVIHCEPRLIPKKDEKGWYFEVFYDVYGRSLQDIPNPISWKKPYLVEASHAIESFCSALDSSAENLINTLDRYGGVIKEPFNDGYKSVRTENAFVRVTEDNFIIETQYRYYEVKRLEYDDNGTPVDITPYLFEDSEYNRLSSYDDTYPNAKLYALRFKQGEKNIDGLNFKRQRTTDIQTQFGDYAIVAILKAATGNPDFKINNYATMRFRVTYTPIYNTRVSQTKMYYKDVRRPANLYFNQQSNLLETKYYGENMKGAVARLGNVEMTRSYYLGRLSDIPKVGDMYDEEYMISGVAVELLPTIIKCSVALTKSFNRISRFIGVSSERRYSEVSEGQASERDTLYREYVVIGKQETADADTRIGSKLLSMITDTFTQSGNYQPISCVIAWGSTYKGSKLPAVILPVISSAFGNSLSFSWAYEDNYSAGSTVNYHEEGTGDEKIEGYFQNTYAYTDLYGKIYYYDFDLRTEGVNGDGMKYPALSEENIPTVSSGYFSTVGQEPYVLRKDNREALQVNVQVDFVTNLKDMIIGSALASYCAAVRGSEKTLGAKLYIFPERLDKFIDHVEGSASVKLSNLPSQGVTVSEVKDGAFTLDSEAFTAGGKSWAIVTNQTTTETTVEDEQGNATTIEEVTGGDVLIARNQAVTEGQEFEPVYFTAKREIFDKTVWKDRL